MQETEGRTTGRRIADAVAESDLPILDMAGLLEALEGTTRPGSGRRNAQSCAARVYRVRHHLEFPYDDAEDLAAAIDEGLTAERTVHWIELDRSTKV